MVAAAEILPIRRKLYPINQSINQSIMNFFHSRIKNCNTTIG